MSEPKYALVAASFYDDDEMLSLQIEFKNGRALTIGFLKEDAPDSPKVTVWTGNGEHELAHESETSFREWARQAIGADNDGIRSVAFKGDWEKYRAGLEKGEWVADPELAPALCKAGLCPLKNPSPLAPGLQKDNVVNLDKPWRE